MRYSRFTRRILRTLCALLWLINAAEAGAAPQNSRAIQNLSIAQLAFTPSWLALGHYRRSPFGLGWRSEADAASFFLSSNGKTDPKAELHATLSAFLHDLSEPPKRLSDNSFCRFPARKLWLELQIGTTLKAPKCPAFEDWMQDKRTTKLSLIFASSFMDSPSSMFGHTYLAFHNNALKSDLLSNTLNYAANTEQKKGIIDFALRGLMGGFPGKVDNLPNYRRIRAYSEIEGRSLWEYPTNFTPAEIELVAAHLWEIRNNVFDYYFLDENCSYRVLSALSVARPNDNLLGNFAYIAIPIDTLRKATEKHITNNSPTYWPSSDEKLNAYSRDLTKQEKKDIATLSNQYFSAVFPRFSSFDATKKQQILLTSMEYLSIKIIRGQADKNISHRNINTIKNYLLQSDIETSAHPTTPPEQPEHGHRSSRMGLFYGADRGKNFVGLNYRLAYHDILDNARSFSSGAEVNFLSLDARMYENGSSALENFTLLDISSRPPQTEFFQPASWNFHVAAERRHFNNESHLTGNIGYLRGSTIKVAGANLSGMIGANAVIADYYPSGIGIEPTILLDWAEQSNNINYDVYYHLSANLENSKRTLSRLGAKASWDASFATRMAVGIEQNLQSTNDNPLFFIGIYNYF